MRWRRRTGGSCCPESRRRDAARAVQAFLAAASVEVERLTSKGIRRVDARAAVVTLELDRRAVMTRTPDVPYFEWLFGT